MKRDFEEFDKNSGGTATTTFKFKLTRKRTSSRALTLSLLFIFNHNYENSHEPNYCLPLAPITALISIMQTCAPRWTWEGRSRLMEDINASLAHWQSTLIDVTWHALLKAVSSYQKSLWTRRINDDSLHRKSSIIGLPIQAYNIAYPSSPPVPTPTIIKSTLLLLTLSASLLRHSNRDAGDAFFFMIQIVRLLSLLMHFSLPFW